MGGRTQSTGAKLGNVNGSVLLYHAYTPDLVRSLFTTGYNEYALQLPKAIEFLPLKDHYLRHITVLSAKDFGGLNYINRRS